MASVIIAEVRRGAHVESVHTGTLVVCDAEGAIVAAAGDAERATFPRSAIKALQALPLVATGAADRWGLTAAELALACASHTGTPAHVETAAAMLAKAGRDVACLECGTHWPSSTSAARALAGACGVPSALHNNCSGKHAGFICAAVAAGRDPAGYVLPDHPTMHEVIAAASAVMGTRPDAGAQGIDGCSIPTYLTSLRAIATGFARFGSGRHLPEGFAQAAARLRGAVGEHPPMIAGAGRFDTEAMTTLGSAVFVKGGAEGVVAGAFPALGLGFALKADDGAARAADAAAAALIARTLGESPFTRSWSHQALRNWNGLPVGEIIAVPL